MRTDPSVRALLEDLEQQASGLRHAERDAEVAELSQAEYSRVTLVERLHASVGASLRVRLVGGLPVSGTLSRVGEGWFLISDGTVDWVVRQAAVVGLVGLSARADAEATWTSVDRLGLRSVLRGIAADGTDVLAHLSHDEPVRGRIGRVGSDFLELHGDDGEPRVVPVGALGALQVRS